MSTHADMRDFVLWLNGAVDMTDDTPTPEQWGTIRARLTEVIGSLMAERMRDAVGKGPSQAQLKYDPSLIYGKQRPLRLTGTGRPEIDPKEVLRQFQIEQDAMERILGMPSAMPQEVLDGRQ